ncbi:diacylglycerol kinase family protein [bacterium]|nr:diacylglycerol kinase family protein [bacterium]
MSKFKTQGIMHTFKNAGRGLRLSIKAERNIRIHLIAAFLVICFALYLKMSVSKICVLIIAISNVMVAEFINTSLEFGLDAIFHNKYSKLVGMAKDISAGAVIVASFFSAVIGLLLFGEELLKIFPNLFF